MHEHRGNRAAALVEVRFDDEARRERIGVRLELEHIRLQKDRFEQVVDMELLLCGNLHEHVRTAPLLGDDAVFGKLLTYPIGVGTGLVDLVHSHDDGHVRRFRVVDRLDGLRHDAVVGGNHEHDDVGHLRAASAHRRKGFVAGRVDERDLAPVDLDDRCADVLGDAARLALGNAGMADRVEQRGLAVVDMPHNGHNRRTGLEILFLVVEHDGVLLLGGDHANLAAHIVGDKLDEIVSHRLREREHLPEHEQALDDVVGLHAEQLGELGNRSTLRNLDDRIVEHERGIEALLDGLELQALAVFGFALFLALLAAAFATLLRCRLDGCARLGEHFVTLELLGLYGHLGIAILARGLLVQLGNLGFERTLRLLLRLGSTLLLINALGLLALLVRSPLLGSVLALGLLLLDTGLLAFDLGKQRIE